MDELKQVIFEHFGRYPEMELQDVFKLIYQNEFGCGHFVTDFERCSAMLADEYHSAPDTAGGLSEPIGNGYCRINLAAARAARIPAAQIAEQFFLSAEKLSGTVDDFLKKARTFAAFSAELNPHFLCSDIEVFLAKWESLNFPLFSHSQTYKNKYSPAYRVILEKYRPCLIPRPL